MKNSKQCPKCQSTKVIKKTFEKISQAPHILRIKISFFKRKSISPALYLCQSCGYMEEWIDQQEEIDLINEYTDSLKVY